MIPIITLAVKNYNLYTQRFISKLEEMFLKQDIKRAIFLNMRKEQPNRQGGKNMDRQFTVRNTNGSPPRKHALLPIHGRYKSKLGRYTFAHQVRIFSLHILYCKTFKIYKMLYVNHK